MHATRTRICGHCDGFAAAAIDAGYRLPDGTRATETALCPACDGKGTYLAPARPRAAVVTKAGANA
ncbi:hypothetical protein OG453_40485 [Streptomyces sp. NBC_01381]|uniref:hypothetical protein n=1 Tax=Streptomyces sp. NBC_01381 TaxID=2903845 RepID=UPI0022592A68|nr:hypothetical protein [Streptomyces sp. NBC_01381]MCX4672850.1 hypothetical protein [Streptomyces sp. NBC_01381]